MDPNIYNLSIKNATSLITSVLAKESERTGFALSVNKYGDLEVYTKVVDVPTLSIPISSLDKIYERIIWELLKSVKGCVEIFSPRRLLIRGFTVATRYQSSVLYASELFEKTPSWKVFVKHSTDCGLDTTQVTSATVIKFMEWVNKLFSTELTWKEEALPSTLVGCRYMGLRGSERFIVLSTDDGYFIYKESGKMTTAKTIYDIELHILTGECSLLPIRILHNKIIKEGGNNGRVSSRSVV